MKDWDANEDRWIKRARKLFREKPDTVLLYTVDGEITACRKGVPSNDLSETVSPMGTISVGAMLTDIHDELTDCDSR
ncbi:MAG: hypothetical protein CSYNP_02804 [Syntrophus sp. SKADARSKE-3]|nr:hypothetical protein [Syntrophus sp. SKADARSKE-3]